MMFNLPYYVLLAPVVLMLIAYEKKLSYLNSLKMLEPIEVSANKEKLWRMYIQVAITFAAIIILMLLAHFLKEAKIIQ